MGNYQEYLKMMPSPLREIDPDQPKRLHTFGNPFKQDKKVEIYQHKILVDTHDLRTMNDVFILHLAHSFFNTLFSEMCNSGDDDRRGR